jgi:hypothetical protein
MFDELLDGHLLPRFGGMKNGNTKSVILTRRVFKVAQSTLFVNGSVWLSVACASLLALPQCDAPVELFLIFGS